MPGKTVPTRLSLLLAALLSIAAWPSISWAQDASSGSDTPAASVAAGRSAQAVTPEVPFWSGPRIAGAIVLSTGISAIVIGAVYAGRSDAESRAMTSHCLTSDPDQCDPEGYAGRARADVAERVAGLSLGVGAAAVFVGFALGWINPETPPEKAKPAVAIAPLVGRGLGGFAILGSF